MSGGNLISIPCFMHTHLGKDKALREWLLEALLFKPGFGDWLGIDKKTRLEDLQDLFMHVNADVEAHQSALKAIIQAYSAKYPPDDHVWTGIWSKWKHFTFLGLMVKPKGANTRRGYALVVVPSPDESDTVWLILAQKILTMNFDTMPAPISMLKLKEEYVTYTKNPQGRLFVMGVPTCVSRPSRPRPATADASDSAGAADSSATDLTGDDQVLVEGVLRIVEEHPQKLSALREALGKVIPRQKPPRGSSELARLTDHAEIRAFFAQQGLMADSSAKGSHGTGSAPPKRACQGDGGADSPADDGEGSSHTSKRHQGLQSKNQSLADVVEGWRHFRGNRKIQSSSWGEKMPEWVENAMSGPCPLLTKEEFGQLHEMLGHPLLEWIVLRALHHNRIMPLQDRHELRSRLHDGVDSGDELVRVMNTLGYLFKQLLQQPGFHESAYHFDFSGNPPGFAKFESTAIYQDMPSAMKSAYEGVVLELEAKSWPRCIAEYVGRACMKKHQDFLGWMEKAHTRLGKLHLTPAEFVAPRIPLYMPDISFPGKTRRAQTYMIPPPLDASSECEDSNPD